MRRAVVVMAAIGIAVAATACNSSGPHHTAQSHAGSLNGARGTWIVASCQVDVTYIDDTNMVDHYVPDTDASFRQHYSGNKASGNAGLAVVVTFVNNTGGPASLPTGLVVSFTNRTGKSVGHPQVFNNANGSGYGGAIAHGHGSGEVFSPGTLFSQSQTVAESPDIGTSVPQQPDLNCHVSQK